MNKGIFQCLAACCIALLGLASCIHDEEVETSPQCAITSFAVSNIKGYVTIKKLDAEGNEKDTTVARTLSGSDVYFNIDQVKGYITTVDSLPNWVDLEHVVATFNCYGNVYRWLEDDKMYLRVESGTDSLDFSKPLELLCLATDGVSTKRYTVEMKKATNSLDTLEWTAMGKTMAMLSADKVVVNGDKAVVFGVDANGNLACTSSTDGKAWSTPRAVDAKDIDAQTVTLFNGELYALALDGSIMRSNDGAAWSVATEQKAVELLCADDVYIYIYNGEAILGSKDLKEWTVQGESDLQMLPTACVSSASYPSRTNKDITVAVMMGLMTSGEAAVPTMWYKMSCKDSDVNQMWQYMDASNDNPYALPNLGNVSMTNDGAKLYAIGTTDNKYTSLYRSVDNGITWQAMPASYSLPADLDATKSGRASLVMVGQQMWIVQQDGNVWVGSMR